MIERKYGGHTVEALRDFIEHSEAHSESIDSITGDDATSASIIADLLDAPRALNSQIALERKLTCDAINGAIMKGGANYEAPPADHWLAPYWRLGFALREATDVLPIFHGDQLTLGEDDKEFQDGGVIGRLSHLLTGVANALKGEPEPLTAHGWADLPELAQKAIQAATHATPSDAA
ncbi:hypothetical protein [Burkholderia anthina]|uniref:hypothetical protein n=1 Tax=Burkholderia anthina TaxID=179879 RepID=UPI00158BFC06|nr:hypothetical protein [Burkholderia anthina]